MPTATTMRIHKNLNLLDPEHDGGVGGSKNTVNEDPEKSYDFTEGML